eukprot:4316472-Amphidinium_carterae.2
MAFEHDLHIEGKAIGQWASELGTSATQLIRTTTGPQARWGNTLDALIIAQKLNIALKIVDANTGALLMQHINASDRPPHTIAWSNYHFFVLCRRTCMTRSGGRDRGRSENLENYVVSGGAAQDHKPASSTEPAAMSANVEPCLLDGTPQSLCNPENLRRREAMHHHHMPPRDQPAPMCWWTDKDDEERTEMAEQIDVLRFLISISVCSADGWKQHSCTPERRPSIEVVQGA